MTHLIDSTHSSPLLTANDLIVLKAHYGPSHIKSIPQSLIKPEALSQFLQPSIPPLDHFKKRPDHEKTYSECKKVILKDAAAYEFFPERFKHYDEFKTLLASADTDQLHLLSKEALTKDICKQAILKHGRAALIFLLNQRPELIDYSMCQLVIANRHKRECVNKAVLKTLEEQRPDLVDYNLCLTAVQTNQEVISAIPSRILRSDTSSTLYIQSCRFGAHRVTNFPSEIKSYDFYKQACLVNGDVLQHVPEDILDENLILAACEAGFLEASESELPSQFFTEKYLIAAVKAHASFLPEVPLIYRTKNICEVAMFNGGENAIQAIPEIYKKEWDSDFYLKVAKQNIFCTFEYIPADKLTPEICEFIVMKYPYELGGVPEKYLNLEFCQKVCQEDYQAIKYLPGEHLSQSLTEIFLRRCSIKDVRKVIDSNRWGWNAESQNQLLKHLIQLYQKDPNLHFRSTQQKVLLISLLSKAKTEKWLQPLGIELNEPLLQLAEEALNLTQFNETDNILPILENTKRYIPALRKLAIRGSKCQIGIAADSTIDKNARKAALGLTPQEPLDDSSLPSNNLLYETVDPLVKLGAISGVNNPFLNNLYQTASTNSKFRPNSLDKGEEIESYIKANTQKPIELKELPTQFQGSDVLFAGGRAIKTESEQQTHYLKIQRKGEPLEDFIREGLIYKYIEEHPELKQKIKSQLPVHKATISIPYESLPTITKECSDELEIIEIEGQKYVHVFHYTASPNYCAYAHKKNTASRDPYENGKEGLKRAVHDLGLLASLGLCLTSILPALHTTKNLRRWLIFHGIFGFDNELAQTGVFDGWLASGTDKADMGYDGIRDIGDSVIFGELTDTFINEDLNPEAHSKEVLEKLIFANLIGEGLLTSQLLAARLLRDKPVYYYRNEEGVKEICEMIESCFSEFVSGYFLLSNKKERSLKEILGVSNEESDKWLRRSAIEILYWTAKQPDEEAFLDNPDKERPVDFEKQDCYSAHLESMKLSEDLFPEQHQHDFRYPKDFMSLNHFTLGTRNSNFVLTSLVRGITKLSAGILST
ncbi:hypothetical protein [Parashewanella spongiae]|nr:hypothetical protein [Parashewanella spongiae]